MPKGIQLAGKLLELDQNYKTSEIVTGAAGRNARGVAVTEDRRGGMNSRRGGDSSNSRQTSDNDNDDDEDGEVVAGLLQEVVIKEEPTVPRVEKHLKMMMMMKMEEVVARVLQEVVIKGKMKKEMTGNQRNIS